MKGSWFLKTFFSKEALVRFLPIDFLVDYVLDQLRGKISEIKDESIRKILANQLPNLRTAAMIPMDGNPNDSEQLEELGKHMAYSLYVDSTDYLDALIRETLGIEEKATITNKDRQKALPMIYNAIQASGARLERMGIRVQR
ncbi:MAG: hypothetical protein HRT61_00825 [Ekhidna sp.]|nr:hypothetical protein [Ekhidna sp.]